MTVLFAFANQEEWYDDSVTFWASSEEFWKKEQHFDDRFRDEHLGVSIPGVSNTMEACFELNPIHGKTLDEAKAYLESHGLKFSQEMQDYVDSES